MGSFSRLVFLQLLVLVLVAAVLGQSNGPIRLWRNGFSSSSYTSGRVQLMYDSVWGNICDDASFGVTEATVICHQLGYTGASSYSRASSDTFGNDSYPIILRDVTCSTSNYLVILQCTFNSFIPSSTSCTFNDDISVLCLSTRIWSSPYSAQIRLTRGVTVNQGLVEVYCSGQWGTVCDDSFGQSDANTVCRQLGYYSAFGYDHLSIRGTSSQPIWLDNVPCSSSRPCIADCLDCPSSENCGHTEDMTIECYSPFLYTGTTTETCRSRNTEPVNLGAIIGGTVGAVVVLIIVIIVLRHMLYTNKRQRGSYLSFSTRHVHIPRNVVSSQTAVVSTTTTTTSSSSQPVPTQAQQAPAAFNMPPPPPTSAYTYNQPIDPTITAAAPPSYGFHSNYSTYDEKGNEKGDEKSDLPPPYQPPAYPAPPSAPNFPPTAYPATAAAYPPPTTAGYPPPTTAGYPPPTAAGPYPAPGGEGTNWSSAAYPPYPPQA